MLWEILGVPVELEGGSIVKWSCATYLGGIADLEESGSSIEHCGLLAWELGGVDTRSVVLGASTNGHVRHGGGMDRTMLSEDIRAGPIRRSGIGGGVEDAGRVDVGK